MLLSFKKLLEMDASTNDVISKLKFIGKIQKGEKINVKYLYVQPTNWLTKISRTFYATDNRSNAYHFIEQTINRCFEIISVNNQLAKMSKINEGMIQDIQDSITGIQNLKDTYAHDVMFCCKLDTLIDNINFRISEFLPKKYMDEPD
jgi:hypothetical protein